jgi:GntR family transcriptional regulator
MNKINSSGNNLPKYVQISELLIRDISSGRMVDGERLPREKQMAISLGVSVGTLRKALKELVKKKMLKRVQGSGNYVSCAGDVSSVYSLFRLELHDGGGLPSAHVLNVKVLSKPKDLPRFGLSNYGTRVRRLRSLNNIIVALEEIWLDSEVARFNRKDLNDSIYYFYRKKLGIWISSIEDRVSIRRVPRWSPTKFGIPKSELTGFIERFSWASDTYPIEYSRTWFDTCRAHYVQRLK